MKRYMLDTNIVSRALKQDIGVIGRLLKLPVRAVCISAITEGELQYGLFKKPNANNLHGLAREFLLRVDSLPWDREVATCYGKLRSDLEKEGVSLGPLDMQIAAHAIHSRTILVSNDHAFKRIKGLDLEDWTLLQQR